MDDPANQPLASVNETTWELLERPSTATLATVLAKHDLWNVFVTGSLPLSPGRRMVGQAYTLRYLPAREDLDHNLVFDNSKDPQRLAIESVGPRDVLVIDARGDERAGTMGNILATRMVARGAAGIVTDGCFRDSPAIAEMDIPAYARSPHAATNKTIHHPVDTQLPVACGGVAVFPGDILVGDDEGVVVIPRYLADEVALAAARQEHKEDFILARIQAGDPLAGTYPPDESTDAQYEAYCQENPPP
jgi:regulator of RNase E activity RraA